MGVKMLTGLSCKDHFVAIIKNNDRSCIRVTRPAHACCGLLAASNRHNGHVGSRH